MLMYSEGFLAIVLLPIDGLYDCNFCERIQALRV